MAHAAAETEPLQAALKRPGAQQSHMAGWKRSLDQILEKLPLTNRRAMPAILDQNACIICTPLIFLRCMAQKNQQQHVDTDWYIDSEGMSRPGLPGLKQWVWWPPILLCMDRSYSWHQLQFSYDL